MAKKREVFLAIVFLIVLFSLFPYLNGIYKKNDLTNHKLRFSTSSPIEILWEKKIDLGAYEVGNSIKLAEDNLYVTASPSKMYKFDNGGIKSLELNTLSYDPIDMVSDSFGNIYIVGISSPGIYPDSRNMTLEKYNSTGVREWSRIWDLGGWEEGLALTLDLNNDIYIAGHTESNPCIAKYNPNGDQIWNHTWSQFGGKFYDITVDANNDIFALGNDGTNSHFVKFNSTGQSIFNHTIPLANLYAFKLASNNTIFLGGYFEQSSAEDFIIMKLNEFREQEWNRTLHLNQFNRVLDIALNSTDSLYLYGYTQTNSDPQDSRMCIIKYNLLGNFQWHHTWGESMSFGLSFVLDNSNIYVTGGMNEDIYVAKMNVLPTRKGASKVFGYNSILIIAIISLISAIVIQRERKKYS